MFAAVIVAAGSSRRAGFDKLAAPLCGRAVLCRSIDAFVAAAASEIIVVCPLQRWLALDLGQYGEILRRVDGGAERQDSVYAGLQMLSDSSTIVAVHDGARPLISPADIRACVQAAQETGAAVCAHPIVDTLKRADASGKSLPEVVSREGLWAMETPQCFDKALLIQAYDSLRAQGAAVTDDVSAMEFLGHATSLVAGGVNMKITLPDDLALAECIWSQMMS